MAAKGHQLHGVHLDLHQADGYRPPGRTLGRRQSRKDTVISPDITASRRSRLNYTSLRGVAAPALPERPRAWGLNTRSAA